MKTMSRPANTDRSTETAIATTVHAAIAAADQAVPGYKRARSFLAEDLEPRLTAILAKRSALRDRHAAVMATDLDVRAAQLLEDAAVPRPDAAARDLAELADEEAVVRRAIELQRLTIDREHRAWSGSVCNQLRAVHRTQVGRIAEALVALSDILSEHENFLAALRESDAIFVDTLRPMSFPKDSLRLNDPASSAALWMTDAISAGLVAG